MQLKQQKDQLVSSEQVCLMQSCQSNVRVEWAQPCPGLNPSRALTEPRAASASVEPGWKGGAGGDKWQQPGCGRGLILLSQSQTGWGCSPGKSWPC